MATAAGDSTSYGGGAGGKFRKRPLRKPQPTPYDRPPTSLRRTTTNDGGGWLSRIVDPASKLITASAHRFFSSVFRKRLLPSPPQDVEVAALENHVEDAVTEVPSRIQEREILEGNTQCNFSMIDGVEELEHILKQKTFTRSEIGRLTELLHSRTVEKTPTEEQRKFELTPSGFPAGHSRQKEFFGTAFEDGVSHPEFPGTELTPAARSKVYVDDVASPTELAKAYMGVRSSRASPSVLGSISQSVREETPFTALQLYRPSVSTVPKPFSPARTSQKEYVVPRSRGRSAIYSMARAPYSRVQSTATKGPGTNNDSFDGQSVLSSQKVLKRRCSVLENDIGSVGPIRRTRQKSNLLYSRTSGLPSSSSPFTNATSSGVGEASSSKSQEDRGEKGIPTSSLHVSSKSIEMGQRILQQLENMTSPKEKSNEKKLRLSGGISAMELTPAMLHGKARKSLETFDSLKYVQHGEAGGKKVDFVDASFEVQDFAAKQQDRFNGSNMEVLGSPSSKFSFESDKARITDNDAMVIIKNTANVVPKTSADVPRKSPAFQMSAYEDYLDLDDDAQMNGVASPSVLAPKSYVQSNGKLPGHTFAEPAKADRPAFPGMGSSSNVLKNTITVDSSNAAAEKGIGHSFPIDSMPNKTIEFSTPSVHPPANTVVTDKAEISASTISFGFKSPENVSLSALESSTAKDVTSSGFAFAAAIKSPESNKKSTDSVNLFKQSDNILSSVPGSFAAPPPVLISSQSASSGSSAYSTFTTPIIGVSTTKFGADAADSAAAISGKSNSLAGPVAFPSSQSTFRGSSATSDLPALTTSGTDSAGKLKETASGSLTNGNLFGAAASVTTQGSAITSFQFGTPTASSTNSQLQASQNVSSKSIFGDQILPSTTASASTIGSVSSQPAALSGSSSLPMTSGSMTSVSAPLSVSSVFGTRTSGSSPVAASGGTNSASTNIFGGSSLPTNSAVFGSGSNNSSSGLNFGTSSVPTPSSSAASAGVAFGTSSVSAPANDSSVAVPFASFSTSNAASSSAAPNFMFGASTPSVSAGLTFGTSSTPAPVNGSTNIVSFGASSNSAASTPSVFAFGTSSSASSSAPSSTLSFGASSTSASSSAPSSTFSFGSSAIPASSSAPSPFSFGAASSSAPSTTFSFGGSSASAPSSAPSSAFSFGAASAPSSSPFSFGASNASASSGALSSSFSFGAATPSATASPAPTFAFGSGASTPPASTAALQPSQPAFGNPNSVFGFGSTPSPSPLGNNEQMSSMEDSMVEDSMQSPTVATPTPVFGQSPTNNFSFGMGSAPAAAPSGANPFQFNGQMNQAAAPTNPFQASGSFDGGSFSLGHGGNDKSARRIVKVKGRNRKK